MERKIHSLPWVEEIATSEESESSFAFPRRLGSPRSDASGNGARRGEHLIEIS